MTGLDPTVWLAGIAALITAVAGWRRFVPEAESATVTQAKELVSTAIENVGVIKEQRNDAIAALKQVTDDVEQLRREMLLTKAEHRRAISDLREELQAVRGERDELRRENAELRRRIEHLEQQT